MEQVEIDYAHHALGWESSKLSQKSYCQSHDINYGKFVAARSKLQASRGLTRAKPRFVEIKPKLNIDNSIKELKATTAKSLSLKFPTGAALDIPLNLSPEQYSNVFSGLKVVL